jgi:hypothetical protein
VKLFLVTASAVLLLALGSVVPASPADARKADEPKTKCKKPHKPGSKKGFCPATVYEIADGTQPAGAQVRVSQAIVTAVSKFGLAAWVAVKPGDTGYTGRDYSGLEVEVLGFSPIELAVGDRVTVDGTVVSSPTGNLLTAAALKVERSGESFDPYEVSASTLTSPAESAPLDAVLVRVPNTILIEDLGSEFVMSGGFNLGDAIIGELPTGVFLPESEFEGVTGIADTQIGIPRLLPRDTLDFDFGGH